MPTTTTFPSPTPSSTSGRRFYELDLLRFVAAVEVMLFHYTIHGYTDGYTTVDLTALGHAMEYFYFGVKMLFVLSGFVILKTMQQKTALGFAAARFLRLGPTYWVCVTLTVVVLLAANANRMPIDLARYLGNLTMAASALGIEFIDGVYWTMEVQLVFYAWVFLLSLAKQLHNADRFLGLWLIAAVVIQVFGGITFTKLDYLLLPDLACYFIAGSVFYLIHQRGHSLYLWSMVAACYVMAVSLAVDGRLPNPTAAVVGNTLLFGLFVRLVTHDHSLRGRPWIITLFKMTYPLYLIHQQVGYVLLTRLDGYMPKYLLLAVVVGIMLLASYVIATQIDRWIMPPVAKAVNWLLRLAGEPKGKRRAPTPSDPVGEPVPAMAGGARSSE
jgi:peptidoglycan/LPS O-acetylase OafA/YrhL